RRSRYRLRGGNGVRESVCAAAGYRRRNARRRVDGRRELLRARPVQGQGLLRLAQHPIGRVSRAAALSARLVHHSGRTTLSNGLTPMSAPARPNAEPRVDGVRVRPYQDSDWDEWLRMSGELFPNEPAGEIAAGMHAFRSRFDAAVFVAERPEGGLAGFVETGARAYADGCETSRAPRDRVRRGRAPRPVSPRARATPRRRSGRGSRERRSERLSLLPNPGRRASRHLRLPRRA